MTATCHGIEVPIGAHLTDDRILSLRDGSFAEGMVTSALAAIRPADRVLHLDAGDGIVAAILARNCQPAFILGFERDAAHVAQARALHRHNGLEDCITLRHGQVLATPEPVCSAALPVTSHDRLRRSCLHNVILLELDGAGCAFLSRANLTGVRLVLAGLPLGKPDRDRLRECRRSLTRAGYERDLGLSGTEVDVFRRVRA